jgi:transmembrane sensor
MENLSNYFENKTFIQKVFESSPESELWLKQFEADHPDEKNNILLARKILSQFRITHKSLTEEDKILLFSQVIKQLEEKQRAGKTRAILVTLLKYAAVALLFFSIGALMFYKRDAISPEFFSQGIPEINHDNSAKLIRSTGENILLEQDNPVIEHSADGNLQIDSKLVATSGDNKIKPGNTFNQLIIPYGRTSQVTLSDGTRVFLNAGSRLVYPEVFTGSTREVLLTGEAFFDVKTDSKTHFIVQTSDLRIKVLGTRFNLSAYPSDNFVEAVLASGKISLTRNDAGFFDKPVELVPGQLASFNRKTMETSVRIVDTDNYILWTEGVVKFESTHLNRILKRMERYYNVSFQFKDPLLGTLQISGKLELKDELAETIERVALAAEVKIEKTAEGIYVVRK